MATISPLCREPDGKAALPTLVLITPARNEVQFIELTINSVVAQTVRPIKWIIVSDGSSDGTDEIVLEFTRKYPWIELIRMPERSERHFAGKVHAFNAGYARVAELDFDVIGNLDGDISFDEDYLANLLMKFAENPKLGVGGTSYRERNAEDDYRFAYDYRFASVEHVPGGCQLFRRRCFEDIGGYKPIKGGLVDTVAAISARMKGWNTETFTDKAFLHHRPTGTAQSSTLSARFKRGEKAYAMGNHPLWELFRTAYQMTQRPFVIGGSAMLGGYMYSLVRRAERPVSREFIAFHRREQMQRLRQLFKARWIFTGKNAGARGKSVEIG